MERQDQMREQNVNLHLHLQHLSEGDDFLNEWIFVESSPIAPGEHNVCPCGQMGLKEHFMIENKINGNRTFVGSECIDKIDPKAEEMNYYIRRLLYQGLQGTYRGMPRNGLVLFSVDSSSVSTYSEAFKSASNKKHGGSMVHLYLLSSRKTLWFMARNTRCT